MAGSNQLPESPHPSFPLTAVVTGLQIMTPRSLVKILDNRLVHDFFLNFKIRQLRKDFALVENLAAEAGIPLFSPRDLPAVDHARYRSCHIIGSGWSLEQSLDLASREDAFVMGFNFAALCGIHFDMYFTEFGDPNVQEVALKQRNLMDDYLIPGCDLIYFKNLNNQKNNLLFANQFYGQRVKFVRDILLPCAFPVGLEGVIKKLLSDEDSFFFQYASSVLTLVGAARRLGFKEIVIHGVDFGGPYFFDAEAYGGKPKYRPDKVTGYDHARKAKEDPHPTNFKGMGLPEAMAALGKVSPRFGVSLYSASGASPLSNLLPVYRPH